MTGTTPSLGPDASEPALSGEAKRDAAGEFLAEMKRQGYGYSDPQWLALMAALRKAAPVIARDALLSLAAELENRATHHLNPVRLTYSAAARMARDRARGTPAQANATAPVSPDPHPDWPRTVAALVRQTGRQVAVFDTDLAYETGTLGIRRAEDPGRWLLSVRDVPLPGGEGAPGAETVAGEGQGGTGEPGAAHEHEWKRCPGCPNGDGPCACAGVPCCNAERAEAEAVAGAYAEGVKAERQRIRELADRNGAICPGDDGTSCYFSALIQEDGNG